MRYLQIAIVRKIGDGTAEDVNRLADVIHLYGKVRDVPVFDHHLGTNLSSNAEAVLFVSLGGDGTLLYAARAAMKYIGSAVVGFNLGSLGFLTEDIFKHSWHPTIFEMLDAIFDFNANIKVFAEERLMLSIDVVTALGHSHHFALNEVLVAPPFQYFSKTTVAVNGIPVTTYGGNGVIVTTATGSTAMGMSAGGAIISPNVDVLQIIPVLAHKVAKQPIIVAGTDNILIRTELNSRVREIDVLGDSRLLKHESYTPLKGEGPSKWLDVRVIRWPNPIKVWKKADSNFFHTLAQKMEWS